MEHTLLEMLEDIKDRLHQLDVALGINGALAAEVFFHLERKVEAAIAKAEGNARLIAAVPDLLEACVAVSDAVARDISLQEELVIAHFTGETDELPFATAVHQMRREIDRAEGR